jgi:hypothetical protein
MVRWLAIGAVVLGGTILRASASDDAVSQAAAVIRQADQADQPQVARAWQTLADLPVRRLTELLAAMDGASTVSKNYLRSAIDRVLERAKAAGQPVPVEPLRAFLTDTRHDPQARRLAYELLVEVDPKNADRFLPNMTDDPSPELRRDAIARVLDEAEKLYAAGKKSEALPVYQKALASVRDHGQLRRIVGRLKELGHPVDVARHLGLVVDWRLLGPFANTDHKGLTTRYPPEEKIDLAAEYEGLAGKAKWKEYVSKDEYGLVNLHAGIGEHPEAVGYAYTEFTSAADQVVDVRVGSYNAFKLWVNGELVLDRGDAYTGMRLDHYLGKARLRAGRNTILVKLVREAPPAPVQNLWQFQLRICDATGAALLSTTRPPSPEMTPAKKG